MLMRDKIIIITSIIDANEDTHEMNTHSLAAFTTFNLKSLADHV